MTLRRSRNEAQEEGEGACSDQLNIALEGLPAHRKASQMPWNVHIWEERTTFSFPPVVGATRVSPFYDRSTHAISCCPCWWMTAHSWVLPVVAALGWRELASSMSHSVPGCGARAETERDVAIKAWPYLSPHACLSAGPSQLCGSLF